MGELIDWFKIDLNINLYIASIKVKLICKQYYSLLVFDFKVT